MRLHFILLGLCAHAASPQRRNREKVTRTTTSATTSESAKGIVENTFEILEHVVEHDKNIALSPLSIVGGMYMLAAGTANESQRQILSALKFGEAVMDEKEQTLGRFRQYYDLVQRLQTQPEKGYSLNIANGIFRQKNMGQFSSNRLQDKYLGLLKENFISDQSHIREVDFLQANKVATDEINQWVSDKTQGKIPELFSEPLEPDTIVMLISTLYFKASWAEKFDLARKNEADNICFALSAQNLVNNICEKDLKWMKKEEEIYYYVDRNTPVGEMKVFDLALKNKKNKDSKDEHKFMLQIWLPDKFIDEADTDKKFRQYISENILTIRRKMGKRLARVTMPMFEIDSKVELQGAMKKLGITDVFTSAADLSPMLGPDQDAVVNQINHAVKVTVDQNGVEGAAATSIQISSRTFSQPQRLDVVKPFYFVISNRCWTPGGSKGCSTGNVPLFVGRVVKPVTPRN